MHNQVMSSVLVTITVMIMNPYKVAGQFSKATLHPNCRKIEPTNHLSRDWGTQLFAGAHFYIPFASTQAINHISQLISGNNGNTNIEKLCARARVRGFKVELEGHDENYMIQECSLIKKGMNDCKINSQSENPEYQQNGNAIAIIVWTDNETTLAIVRCTYDGRFNDWYTFSTLTSLNETMQKEITSSLDKLGFTNSINDAISPPYQGCKLFSPEEIADDYE